MNGAAHTMDLACRIHPISNIFKVLMEVRAIGGEVSGPLPDK